MEMRTPLRDDTTALELKDLTRHYTQGKSVIKALDGVSLTIERGEFVSVVGRSGSGKTTMLDLIGLLLRPTTGSVLVDGFDTARMRDGERADVRSRRIGFIFQEYNLLPSLNVIENVMLPLRYAGSNIRDGRERALQLLDLVGLADRLNHRPDQLSGGQQQRVAIARALVNRPTLVLADEPTGAVDTQTAADLLALMRALNRDEGVTFVIVTHDMELASKADRMIRLKDGRVLSDEEMEPSLAVVATA
jgi:putative ABC transport system ATP-binding protein